MYPLYPPHQETRQKQLSFLIISFISVCPFFSQSFSGAVIFQRLWFYVGECELKSVSSIQLV